MPNGIDPHDPYQLDRRLTILETRFDTILPSLATKADLAELRAELRGDLHSGLGQITKWMVILTATMFIGFGGMIMTLFSLLQR